MGELGTNNTRVAVSSRDAAPQDADLGATNLLGCLVDVGDTLAEVELGVLGLLDTLDLDEGGVALGDALRALVAHNPSLNVKTRLKRVKQRQQGGWRRRVSETVGRIETVLGADNAELLKIDGTQCGKAWVG